MDPTNEIEPVDVVLCIDQELYDRLWEVIRHLLVGLVDLNARVRLLSSSPQAQALTLGPIQTIVHQELAWLRRRQRLTQLIDALSVRKPTAIHALSAGTYWGAAALADAFSIDLVVHVTGLADIKALDRVPPQRVQHVVATSQPLYDELADLHRYPPNAISLIRPGVLRSAEPSCFVEPGRVPTLLCTSDLEEGRGVAQLLHAVRLLRDRGHDFLTFLSGEGRQERQLRKLVAEKRIAPWVTFARPRTETSRLMTGADVCVRPGAEAALASSTLLAMATGTAVVCCAGGVTDHCLDGRTAVVCPDGQPASLADGIERLLGDWEYARTLAASAMAYMKEHYAVSTMAEQLVETYHQLRLRRHTFSMKRQRV